MIMDDMADDPRRLEDPTKRLFWHTYSPGKQLELLAKAWQLIADEFKALAK